MQFTIFLEIYNNILEYLTISWFWYYQKLFIHPNIEGFLVEEVSVSTKEDFLTKKFIISDSYQDYSKKIKHSEYIFNSNVSVPIYLTDIFGDTTDITTVMSFYLDPSGTFWGTDISEIPRTYFDTIFNTRVKKVDYFQGSLKTINY